MKMSGIIKNLYRLPALKPAKNALKPVVAVDLNRMHNVRNMSHMLPARPQKLHHFNKNCNCSFSVAGLHTQGNPLLDKVATTETAKRVTEGEKELAEFLVEEINSEKKLQKTKKIPSELNGFTVKVDGSEVMMRKQLGDEVVEVNFNINHTVDTDEETEVDPSSDKVPEMKSRPNFEVEIKKGNKTLGFTCSMVAPPSGGQQSDDAYNDLFAIDEIVMYEGDWKETNYSVSGEVLDGTLYDLLMNLLEDKGVNNEFIDKLVEFSTTYEHSCYIGMLEDMQTFVKGAK